MAAIWKTIPPNMILPPLSGSVWFPAAIAARAPPTPWTLRATRSAVTNTMASVIEFRLWLSHPSNSLEENSQSLGLRRL